MVQASQPIGQENPLLIDVRNCAGLRCFPFKSRYPLFAAESALPTDGVEPGANKRNQAPSPGPDGPDRVLDSLSLYSMGPLPPEQNTGTGMRPVPEKDEKLIMQIVRRRRRTWPERIRDSNPDHGTLRRGGRC